MYDGRRHRVALSRRRFLSLAAVALTGAATTSVLAACQAPAPQPTAAPPKPTEAPKAAAPAPTTAPAAAPAATSPAAAKATGEPIKLGVVEPLSGAVAASGGYVRQGAEIGRDWINDRGGVLGRPIQLLIEDNKSDPKEAANAVEKLIVSDSVPAIMGCWGSSMTLAAMPKMEQYEVPLLVETSSAASITTSGNPFVFRISPPSSGEAAGMEKYYDDLQIKKADFLCVNTDFGRGAATAFSDLVKNKGGTVGVVEFMEQPATDMGAQLTKIQQSGGDTLFVTTSVEQFVLVFKQAQERRLSPTIITTGGSSSPDQLIEQAGSAAENTYHIVFFLPWFPEAMPDPTLAKAFIDEWKKRGHPEGGLTEGFRGHDGILTLAEAVKLAGKAEAKDIRDALWNVNVMGVNGPIKFEKDGPSGKESGQSQASIFMVQIKEAKVTLPPFVGRG
jgi:branched-chain amino acid transport system substrate-binding protein